MQSQKEVDKEDLYTLKINCKGKRTVGKANKGINLEKNNNRFKKIKIKKKKRKKGRLHRTDFPGGSDGKPSVYNAGDLGSIPGSGSSLEKEKATHSSTLA